MATRAAKGMNMAREGSLLRKLDTVPHVPPSVAKVGEHLLTRPGEVPDPGYFFDPNKDYLGECWDEAIDADARGFERRSGIDLPR